MDYKKLGEEIKAFLSNCERVRYGELVGAPWPYNHDGPMVYTEPEDILLDQAATAIIDLLARAEAAEARAEKAEKELEAAVKELDGVQSSVDDLAEFIDEQIHPLVPYGFYTDLRENADSISMWQYEKEWRGQKEE